MSKRTALYEEHLKLAGKMVDFGGWQLPVQYKGLAQEHRACRSSAGIFDVSHMGEIFVRGSSAEKFLNFLAVNDISKAQVGQAQYTAMCNEQGGIVDDLVIYRRAPDDFLLVVNASNTDKDFAHIQSVSSAFEKLTGETSLSITNESRNFSQIALQGKNAVKILKSLTDVPLDEIRTYWFAEGTVLKDTKAIIARTGYTGEDGFEIYVPWDAGPVLWQELLRVGREFELEPCGLGARDTLRLEMKYPLYGHELNDETSPLESGLSWITKLSKETFWGKWNVLARKELGSKKTIAGIAMRDKGIPRQGYSIFSKDNTRIGEVTSGTHSPSLNQPIAIVSILEEHAAPNTEVSVEIRGNRFKAVVCTTPFYRRPQLEPRY